MPDQSYDINQGVINLAKLRDQEQKAVQELADLQMQFDILHQPLRQHIADVRNAITKVDTELREESMRLFCSTGDPCVHDAITVRKFTQKVYDVEQAIVVAAAIGRFDLLQPQKAKMNEAAKAGLLPGINIADKTEWKAAIKEKLGEYVITTLPE